MVIIVMIIMIDGDNDDDNDKDDDDEDDDDKDEDDDGDEDDDDVCRVSRVSRVCRHAVWSSRGLAEERTAHDRLCLPCPPLPTASHHFFHFSSLR